MIIAQSSPEKLSPFHRKEEEEKEQSLKPAHRAVKGVKC